MYTHSRKIKLKPLLQAQAHTKQVQQGQSNLTNDKDVVAKSNLPPIEKTDKTNLTTKKQMSQAQIKKKATERLERESKLKQSMSDLKSLVENKQDKSHKNTDTTHILRDKNNKIRKQR